MLVTNRVNYILKTINRLGKVSVINLSKELNVSLETIRRDLKQLDEEGELVRIHGGAINKKYKDEGTSFNNRAHLNINDKKILVDQVIENIYEGCVIGLDASSSSWLVAQAMPDLRCTVVTNSLNNINALSEKRNITTIALGGYFSEKYKAFYGLITRNNLIEMTLDLCVISCVGFDKESGVWDSNEYNFDVKRTLIEVSNKSILIADKSKHRKKSLLKICNIDEIDILISNAEI